jgi:hypothetical protein
MKEQIAEQPPVARKPVYRGGAPKQGETVYLPDEENLYTTDEPIEDDGLIEEDEDPYTRHHRRTRHVSLERTCRAPRTPAANRTMMHVTRHAGPPPIQRTARTATSTPQQRQPAKQAEKRLHWLFYVGCGAMASAALWFVGSTAFSWLQTQHDTSLYGYPRTYQVDENVGHAGISHFISENLHGDILVIEVQPSNLTATKVYQGPTFSGAGTDLQPATLSFQDVNSDGKPDMVISIGNGRYVLINTGSSFRPSTPADKINQQEVQ